MSLQVRVDFQVLAESDAWIVVDKPAPLIVHPANRKPEPTLLGGVEILLAYEMENGARPAIVTRLDRETSGVVLIAKTAAAARELGMVFEQRLAEKIYLAIVEGWPDWEEFCLSAAIARAGDVGDSRIWVRQIVHPSGRACSTRFEVTQRFRRDDRKFALVRCFPKTGRMHQLRVHLAHLGYPIVGDKLYHRDGAAYLTWMAEGWTDALEAQLLWSRQALHAAELTVPWQGSKLTWAAPMPADFLDFIAGRPMQAPSDLVIWDRHAYS